MMVTVVMPMMIMVMMMPVLAMMICLFALLMAVPVPGVRATAMGGVLFCSVMMM